MKTFWIFLFFIGLSISPVSAQPIVSMDFEQFSSEAPFTQASWKAVGLNVPWVDGFNQNRVHIDANVARSGRKSIRVDYPKGMCGPQGTGAQAPLLVAPQPQYYMSYFVRFSDNFSWGTKNEGGKLPGLSGGARCSGCDTCTGSNGFTVRLMWRKGGKAVLYLYHMDKVEPCGENYEIVVDGSTLQFQKGQWYKISQRVKVNTTDNHDGEVEIWVNDRHAQLRNYQNTLVNQIQGIRFVSNGDKVDNLYFSTFHGGNDADWAPTVDCYTWFDDLIVSTHKEDAVSVATGLLNAHIGSLLEQLPSNVKSNERYRLSAANHSFSTEWYDRLGSCVGENTSNNGELYVPVLSSGMYVLKVKSEDAMDQKLIWVE